MIYNIYVNYNKKVEAYERPLILMEDDNEYIERIKRDFKASTPDAQEKIGEYLINKVGTFDDNTGVITLEVKNTIFDCGVLLLKGDVKDGSC